VLTLRAVEGTETNDWERFYSAAISSSFS
jgi:hypothetical protein